MKKETFKDKHKFGCGMKFYTTKENYEKERALLDELYPYAQLEIIEEEELLVPLTDEEKQQLGI